MTSMISVLMGIYNCESTLSEAVDAIRRQSYPYWELILCDDGSTDGTLQCAEAVATSDSRIRVIKNDKNHGLAYTLNHCLQYAKGTYIARMDGDDLCNPDRFQKQIDFLDSHPEFAICSTPMILFDETGEWGRTKVKEYPRDYDVVTGSPIHHAPVMMRREALEAVGGYTVSERTMRVEDVDLWIKLYAAGYKCYNLQEPLYSMRNDRNAFQRRKYQYRVNSTLVRLDGCKSLGLGATSYVKAFAPMIIGLIPNKIRQALRKSYKR